MVKKNTGKIMVAGKRKTSVAKAIISNGSGNIKINNVSYDLLPKFKKLTIREPIDLAKNTLKNFEFDVSIKVVGGGQESQIEAARLALAKALVKFTKSAELRKVFLEYDRNLLVADTRRKEAYKPGDSKARRKRQKSYR